MKPIITVPSNVISPSEKKKIEDEGYILIITDEPEKIKHLNVKEDSLLGLTRERLLKNALYVLRNANKANSTSTLKEWFLTVMLNEMGVANIDS